MANANLIRREELYDLVWREPRSKLAKRFGISDVAIAKACGKAGIPMPPRGYWAKKESGRVAKQIPLPPRKPGADEDVRLGGSSWDSRWHLSDQELQSCAITPPVFDEPIEHVRERIKAQLGKVTQPRTLKDPHELIIKMLDEDEIRRKKIADSQYGYALEKPIFESPSEKRRLRILSGLFKVAGRCGTKPYINSKDAREFGIRVGSQHVSLALDLLDEGRRKRGRPGKAPIRFRLTIKNVWRDRNSEELFWEDNDNKRLEEQLRDIVEEVILSGERQYRAYKKFRYQQILERKQELDEAERARLEEEARQERERIEKLRQERIDRLLNEAADYQKACDIREYVDTVLSSVDESSKQDELKIWAQWAKAVADDLDPIVSGDFKIDEIPS